MQIAQILAGYSLGEADLLRRAMGKKIREEMEEQRERFVAGAVERGVERAPGRRDLRPARALRRLRLQQEPCRGLCAGRLSDRLYEGELPGRVPGRVDDARHGQHRQARRIPRRGGAARHQGRAALGQPLRRRLRGRRQHHPSTRSPRSRASARRRSKRSSRRAASGRSPISPISPRRINPRAVNKRVLESLAAAGAFDALERNRARVFAAVDAMLAARAARARGRGDRPERAVRRRVRRASRSRCRRSSPGCRPSGCSGIRRHRLLPLRPSARRLCRGAQAAAGAVLGGIRARGEGRRDAPAGSPAPWSRAPSGAPDRQQDGHHRPVRSDRPLRGGAVLRRAGAISATCSSRARRCCCCSRRKLQGDEVRARIQIGRAARSGGGQAAKGPARVPARRRADRERRQAARAGAARGRTRQGDGEVSVVLMLERRHRGRGEAARPFQGLAADRRRHQGRAGRGAGRGRVRVQPAHFRGSCQLDNPLPDLRREREQAGHREAFPGPSEHAQASPITPVNILEECRRAAVCLAEPLTRRRPLRALKRARHSD